MRTDTGVWYFLRASLQLTKIFGYFCKKVTKENKAEMYPADYFVLFIFLLDPFGFAQDKLQNEPKKIILRQAQDKI